MNLLFKADNGEEFSLGTYSFEIINKRDVFDEDDLSGDYYNETIIELNTDGCQNVAKKVEQVINIEYKHRKDLKAKLEDFVKFLKGCKYVKAKIC